MRAKSMAEKLYIRRKNTGAKEDVDEGGNGEKKDAQNHPRTVENPSEGKDAEIKDASPNKNGAVESEANVEKNREDEVAKYVDEKKDSAKSVETGTMLDTEASSSNNEGTKSIKLSFRCVRFYRLGLDKF